MSNSESTTSFSQLRPHTGALRVLRACDLCSDDGLRMKSDEE